MLETNSLGGEKRSPWYACGNWEFGAFTQGCAPSRQAETGPRESQHSANSASLATTSALGSTKQPHSAR